MTRPSRDIVLMSTATAFARRSTCSRAQVGAVFSRDGRILTTGYNGAPAGMLHCQHALGGGGVESTLVGCRIAVHAEANGIAWAARNGVALQGSELHTTLSPCYACAQLLINAGVARVMYWDLYRDDSGLRLLREADVLVEELIQFP